MHVDSCPSILKSGVPSTRQTSWAGVLRGMTRVWLGYLLAPPHIRIRVQYLCCARGLLAGWKLRHAFEGEEGS